MFSRLPLAEWHFHVSSPRFFLFSPRFQISQSSPRNCSPGSPLLKAFEQWEPLLWKLVDEDGAGPRCGNWLNATLRSSTMAGKSPICGISQPWLPEGHVFQCLFSKLSFKWNHSKKTCGSWHVLNFDYCLARQRICISRRVEYGWGPTANAKKTFQKKHMCLSAYICTWYIPVRREPRCQYPRDISIRTCWRSGFLCKTIHVDLRRSSCGISTSVGCGVDLYVRLNRGHMGKYMINQWVLGIPHFQTHKKCGEVQL